MKWNWTRPKWPHFVWKKEAVEEFEQEFLKKAGVLLGASKQLNTNNQKLFLSQMITFDVSSDNGDILFPDNGKSKPIDKLKAKGW